MTDNSVANIQIQSIKIAGRFRKDHGDIATLAASIEQLGLLQPIGVTASHELVFGHRRLLAFQRLGLDSIPARVIDVPALVLAEHAENEIRKDFTAAERVEIGKAVEAELGKRQGQRTDLANKNQGGLLGELSQNFDEVPKGRTDVIAAQKAGFGNNETYRQAKTVVEKGIPELAEAMDSTIAISTAAKLAVAPVEVQHQAVANPKKAVELAKAASQQKAKEIKTAAVEIHKSEVQADIAALRELRPAPPETAHSTPQDEPPPHDPVFDTVLPNGRNIADGDPKALWLWGWMLEYEDRFLSNAPPPEELASNFLEFMEKDSRRLVPQISHYLNKLLECFYVSAA